MKIRKKKLYKEKVKEEVVEEPVVIKRTKTVKQSTLSLKANLDVITELANDDSPRRKNKKKNNI